MINCGERKIEVAEDEDVIFDCNLVWHGKLEGPFSYIFKKKITTKTVQLSDTEEPIVVKKSVRLIDSGTYICSTVLKPDTVVSEIQYNVKVTQMKGPKVYKPRPTLGFMKPIIPHIPSEPDVEQMITLRAQLVILFASAGIVIFIAGISAYMFRRKKLELLDEVAEQAEEKRRQKREDLIQMSL
ncbi:hypothetical protein FKM82_013458 [Ascaphus truei]